MQRLEEEQVAGAKGAAGMERRCPTTQHQGGSLAGKTDKQTRIVSCAPLAAAESREPLPCPACSTMAMRKVIVDERDLILARWVLLLDRHRG
jgi:hypothetical protein